MRTEETGGRNLTDQLMEFQEASAAELKGKYLTFLTDGQLFGVPIAQVVQIVGMQEITQIPEFPSYAKGIINLRGSIIPVIDVRLRMEKPPRAYDERTCIIVTLINSCSMGLIVDEVDAVATIGSEALSPPPQLSQDSINSYLTAIAKLENEVVLLLDTAKLLSGQATRATENKKA